MYHVIHQYAKDIQYDIQLAVEKEQKLRRREEYFFEAPKMNLKNQHGLNYPVPLTAQDVGRSTRLSSASARSASHERYLFPAIIQPEPTFEHQGE